MISYRLVYNPKPLGPIIREIQALFMTNKETPVAAILFFQNEAKNISSQDFIMRNISYYPVDKTKSKCNSFQVISDLLNTDNLTVAITQLCHELQV